MSSRRGILIVLILIVLAVAASATGLVVLGLAVGAPPAVPSNATLHLRITAPLSELDAIDVFGPFVPTAQTLRSTLDTLARAKRDTRVKSLVVKPQTAGALWGQLQELRQGIDDFRQSGKPVTAFLESGGAAEYFLASGADRIVMMPAGQLDLSGLATYELFFRGSLDKMGVYPDMLHIGDYKTASNTFVEKGFTPAHREMSQSLNKDWFDQLVVAIAERRRQTPADVRRAIDAGPFQAEGAKRAGLVDELAYEDQLQAEPAIKGTRHLEGADFLRASSGSFAPAGSPRVALVYAVGTIASGRSEYDGLGGNVVGSDTFGEWLRKIRLDASIRAVVIRIDSPGGSAIASEVMWREIKLTREVKPVIVSMGDVAASGGYYIAAPADHIVAQPGTITGSIGVVTGKFVLKGTFDKLGVGVDAVSDGRLARIYSPFAPFTPDERGRVAEQMQATYELFVSRVAEGRKSTPAKIDAIAQGRVWTGRQARDLGLVDELGSLGAAIQQAKQRAKLDLKKDVQLVVYPPRRTLYDLLADPVGVTADARAEASALRPEVRALQSVLALPRLFRRGEPLAILPNIFWR